MFAAAVRFFVFIAMILISGVTAPAKTFLLFPLDESFPDRDLEWIAEGVAESLSVQLAGLGVGVIGRGARLRLLEAGDLPPAARLSRGTMIRMTQSSGADLLILGNCSGTEQDLEISLRTLDMDTLKLSGEITAAGPLAALPQLENELLWRILTHTGLDSPFTRESVSAWTRKVPNASYSSYIQSLYAPSEKEQMRLLGKALATEADFPGAHFHLGRLYYQNRQWPQAISHLLRATGAAVPRWPRDFWLGNSLLQSGRLPEALRALAPAAFLQQNAAALNNFGVACLRIGEDTAAAYVFAFAQARSPEDPTIAANMAVMRSLRGDAPAALAALEQVLPDYPESGMLHFIRGFLLRANGDAGRAADSFARAQALGISLERLESTNPRSWARALMQAQPDEREALPAK